MANVLNDKKVILNIKNNNNRCFLWSVLAHLHPVPRANYAGRGTQYTSYEYTEMTMNGLAYPITLCQISKFEKPNISLSINVFGFDDIVFLQHITDKRDRNHVNLLLIANEDVDQYYCLIRNLSRLLGKRTYHNGNYCLHAFTKTIYSRRSYPLLSTPWSSENQSSDEQNKWLMFKNRMHQQRVPFVFYADCECFTPHVDTCIPNPDTSYKHTSQTHEPSGFCYRVVCAHSKHSMDAVVYRGQNVIEI